MRWTLGRSTMRSAPHTASSAIVVCGPCGRACVENNACSRLVATNHAAISDAVVPTNLRATSQVSGTSASEKSSARIRPCTYGAAAQASASCSCSTPARPACELAARQRLEDARQQGRIPLGELPVTHQRRIAVELLRVQHEERVGLGHLRQQTVHGRKRAARTPGA